MSELKKKPTFSNIWKLLLEADTVLGLYFLKDPPKKKTLLEWIYRMTWPRHALMYHFFLVTTLIVTNYQLISVILCASLYSIFITVYLLLINYLWNKETMIDLLSWCEGLYDVEKKFHPWIRTNLAEKQLISMERLTVLAIKLFRLLIYVDSTIMTIGFGILGIFLPDSIIPKFTIPTPFYLPFKSHDNWTAFLVTIFYQAILCYDLAAMVTYLLGIFFTVVLHILGYLDIIVEVAKQMNQNMASRLDTSLKLSMRTYQSQSKLENNIMRIINNNLDNINGVSFDDWMKILTNMITDVNVKVSLISKFYSIYILTNELSSFGSLFTCGLVFIIVRQQYLFAVIVNIVILVLWLFCYANEKILEKFIDIKFALYDVPWYEFEPKQRRMLLIAMSCSEIQKGFTASGIHSLTMERFGIIVKAGYTNMLALKDLIQK